MKSLTRLQQDREEVFLRIYAEVAGSTSISTMEQYIQHGNTSCLRHSIAVAYYSYCLMEYFNIRCCERSLIRGALLHDYFLYDWHEKDDSHKWHGFRHPSTSLRNAKRDVDINEIEEDLIKHHMFPLTVVPPMSREATVVCVMDKICSIYELKRKRRYERLHLLVTNYRHNNNNNNN